MDGDSREGEAVTTQQAVQEGLYNLDVKDMLQSNENEDL